jgi:hypothetical protein
MFKNRARIAALEAKQPGQPTPMVIYHQDGETFADACVRQGVEAGTYLSLAEPMSVSDWCETARAQQSALTGGTP